MNCSEFEKAEERLEKERDVGWKGTVKGTKNKGKGSKIK